ncbi:MAG: hypothetical protein ISS72_08630 [Candidatus Brocadiae bacterium]|nr:hypothetical protein [Candidatus Brocadiia bacterium]
MNRSIASLLPVLLGLLAAGCPDPNLFHSSGSSTTPPPRSTPPRSTARSATNQGDIRVAPARVGGRAAKDDVRIFGATPTMPGRSPNNVAIVIEKLGADSRTATEANLAFRYANDGVGVRGGSPAARRNGIRVGVAGDNFRAQLQASHRRSRSSTSERMFITCLSGTEGQIVMGTDTFVQRLGYWGPHGYHVLIERAMIGRSLVVRPTILPGGMVQVTVWPRFTTRSRRGAIDVTELSTTAVVRDGQSIVIGGLTTGKDDVSAALFGVGRDRRSSTMTMVLTPKIGGMDIEWPKGAR